MNKIFLIAALLLTCNAIADVRLPGMFSDSMVLQQMAHQACAASRDCATVSRVKQDRLWLNPFN